MSKNKGALFKMSQQGRNKKEPDFFIYNTGDTVNK